MEPPRMQPKRFSTEHRAPTRRPPTSFPVKYQECGCGELFPEGARVSCLRCTRRRYLRLGVWV